MFKNLEQTLIENRLINNTLNLERINQFSLDTKIQISLYLRFNGLKKNYLKFSDENISKNLQLFYDLLKNKNPNFYRQKFPGISQNIERELLLSFCKNLVKDKKIKKRIDYSSDQELKSLIVTDKIKNQIFSKEIKQEIPERDFIRVIQRWGFETEFRERSNYLSEVESINHEIRKYKKVRNIELFPDLIHLLEINADIYKKFTKYSHKIYQKTQVPIIVEISKKNARMFNLFS